VVFRSLLATSSSRFYWLFPCWCRPTALLRGVFFTTDFVCRANPSRGQDSIFLSRVFNLSSLATGVAIRFVLRSRVDTPSLKIDGVGLDFSMCFLIQRPVVGPPARARCSPNHLVIYLPPLLSAVDFSVPGFPSVPLWFGPTPVFHGARARLHFWSQRWRGNFSLDL
jgi:hypothetical protein